MLEVKCNECSSTDVIKAGWRWRRITNQPPKRIKVRQFRCRACGKLFVPDDTLEENIMEGK